MNRYFAFALIACGVMVFLADRAPSQPAGPVHTQKWEYGELVDVPNLMNMQSFAQWHSPEKSLTENRADADWALYKDLGGQKTEEPDLLARRADLLNLLGSQGWELVDNDHQ